jgi:mono/diheme cytochrome c family protein
MIVTSFARSFVRAAGVLSCVYVIGTSSQVTPSTAGESAGVSLPMMDSKRGRLLYVSKGCVGCHAINGIGGMSAAPLDAATMDASGNPFEFFARMWLGTKPMIAMQEDKMGQQVELTAQELGDIVAFIHDKAEQSSFSGTEIPDNIEDIIESD